MADIAANTTRMGQAIAIIRIPASAFSADVALDSNQDVFIELQ
jgi:hypothetical protein